MEGCRQNGALCMNTRTTGCPVVLGLVYKSFHGRKIKIYPAPAF
ncbi:MAG: hypothetical protein AVDCRST_MAG95-828 [uncultured Adhaeribacter sp.]|uniref:Uncharacterized protein n=1 Tax=uncultured Adhaeribacter sp. TaxID=448109 RepID=A0A6J4HLN3_9BACT|nr:MAG: hypothetical protein AVDCRST_MAG95-828 [uncultured Adhaeribacter sp.]